MKSRLQRAMLYVTTALRSIRRALSRYGLAALGIAVATGFAASASWVYFTANAALGADARAGLGADAVWSMTVRPMTAEQATALLNRPEIEAWSPALFGRATVRTPQRVSIVTLKGIVPEQYPFFGRERLYGSADRLQADEVALTRNAADRLNVDVGDSVELFDGVKSHPFRVAHIVTLYNEHATDANVIGVAYVRLEQARALLESPGDLVDEVALKLRPATAIEPLLASLEAAQPLSRTYSAADEQKSARAQVSTLLLYVQVFGLVAVVIATIGITNTMTLLVADRVKEIATLKAVGLRPAQVTAMILTEGALAGGIGVLLGLVAATLLSTGAAALLGRYLQLELPFRFYAEPLLLGLVVGLGASVAATWLPALQASRVPPALAWQDAGSFTTPGGVANSFRERLLLLICAGTGIGVYLFPLLSASSLHLNLFASALTGIFAALLGALLLTVLGWLGARLFVWIGRGKRVARRSLFLALHTLAGHSRRFALTCICVALGVVTVAVSLMLGTTVQEGLHRQLTDQSGGNIFVSAPPGTEPEVQAALAGVASLDRMVRTVNGQARLEQANGRPALEAQQAAIDGGATYLASPGFPLQGMDLAGNRPRYAVVGGRDLTPADEGQPVLLMLEQMARDLNIHPGDAVTLGLGGQHLTFKVVGLLEGELVKTAFMRTSLGAMASTGAHSVTYNLELPPEQVSPTLQRLNRTLPAGAYALSLDDHLMALTQTLQFQSLVLTFISLLALAAAILLILNEVATAIAKQQKEFATMKVLGVIPGNLLKGIIIQYATVGFLGGWLGIALAVALTLFGAARILHGEVRIPWAILGVPFLTALVAALTAAISATPGISRRPVESLRN